MAKTTIVDFYKVDQSERIVTLEIIIGYAQIAATSVMLNQNIIGDFENSFTTELGSNVLLQGKELFITTIVHDVNDETDNTSVIVKIDGGVVPYKGEMDFTVSGNGSLASYAIDIEFYQ